MKALLFHLHPTPAGAWSQASSLLCPGHPGTVGGTASKPAALTAPPGALGAWLYHAHSGHRETEVTEPAQTEL